MTKPRPGANAIGPGNAGANGKSAATNGKPKIVESFDYKSEDGTIRFRSNRIEPGRDGRPKSFTLCAADGRGGFKRNLDGVETFPYRLPELMGSSKEQVVFIAEGERKVDALVEMGLIATCNPGGAHKWKAEYGQYLQDRHVTILADNDDAGLKHAKDVARKLNGVAASTLIVQLPGLAPKGDILDWLQIPGNDKVELLEIVQAAQREKPANAAADQSDHDTDAKDDGRTEAAGIHLTDVGNAKRLIIGNGQELRHCWPWHKWLTWDASRWRVDDVGDIARRAKKTITDLFAWTVKRMDEIKTKLKEAEENE